MSEHCSGVLHMEWRSTTQAQRVRETVWLRKKSRAYLHLIQKTQHHSKAHRLNLGHLLEKNKRFINSLIIKTLPFLVQPWTDSFVNTLFSVLRKGFIWK